jgi:hypothetical protein
MDVSNRFRDAGGMASKREHTITSAGLGRVAFEHVREDTMEETGGKIKDCA